MLKQFIRLSSRFGVPQSSFTGTFRNSGRYRVPISSRPLLQYVICNLPLWYKTLIRVSRAMITKEYASEKVTIAQQLLMKIFDLNRKVQTGIFSILRAFLICQAGENKKLVIRMKKHTDCGRKGSGKTALT